MSMKHIICFAAALLASSGPPPAFAAEGSNGLGSGQLHGFLAQGFVKTDNNRFFGASDEGSFEFTEIGLNGSVRPRPELLLSGQLLARKAGEMYDGSPTVDFALAHWNFVDDASSHVGVSVGRLKNPIGLYNETRDVAHTRPGIFMPQVIYYDKVRDLEMSSDGVGLHLRRFNEMGEWAFDLNMGRILVDDNVEAAFLGADWAGALKADGTSYVSQLRFTTPDERWRLALSYSDARMRFERGTDDPMNSGDVRIRFLVGSAQFNDDDWTLTAEYAYEPIKWSGFDTPLLDGDVVAESYYLQAERHLGRNVTLLARYEEGYANRDDRDGILSSQLRGAPPYTFYTKTFTVGARWDVTPQFMLRAEYAANDGTFVLSTIENPVVSDMDRRWNVFSLLGAYRF